MNIWLVVTGVIAALCVGFMAVELISFLRVATQFLAERTLELQSRREHRELREATRDDIAV